MKIGKCRECESKKVYIEKDGKCVECLKQEGDSESAIILRIDICDINYNKIRECIEKAKSRNGFIRIQHRKQGELTGPTDCDLDVYKDEIMFYGRPMEGRSYKFSDFEGKTKKKRIIKALTSAYQDTIEQISCFD